jgi:hypothetical protein
VFVPCHKALQGGEGGAGRDLGDLGPILGSTLEALIVVNPRTLGWARPYT